MEKQPTQFPDRAALVAHVKALSPGVSDDAVSETRGGRSAAEALLAAIDPTAYGHNRNYLDGAATRLSPYIRHAIVSLNELRNQALEIGDGK
ncbi:DNA photolyase, partial [Alphaproteobacteria bacterium]|nr:DNA photolyase [Alphaproteobacteria bacterium]